MTECNEFAEYEGFYRSIGKVETLPLILYIVFSVFTYAIYWIYKVNVELEKADENAPDSKRGLVTMCLVPFAWAILHFILENFVFVNNDYLLKSIEQPVEFFALVIICFLILKYFLDFSNSFAKVTFTNNLIWLILMAPGFIGIVLLGFELYYATILLIFPVISIIIMQKKLNKTIRIFDFKCQD